MNKKSFFTGSIFFFLASSIASVVNYLFSMMMGRMLTLADYSVFLSLIALVYIFSVPTGALQTITIKYTASLLGKSQLAKMKYFWQKASAKVFWGSLIFYLVFLALSPFLARFLQIPNVPLFAFFGVSVFFFFLIVISRGVMMGRHQFFGVAVNSTLEPILKLALALLLVGLGFRVYGAIAGLIFGLAIAYVVSLWQIRDILRKKAEPIKLANLIPYLVATLLALLAMVFFQNGDYFLVKHFFTPEQAGLYGGVTTVGRIILFLSAPITAVMFPIITRLYENKEPHTKILFFAFLAVFALSLVVFLAFAFQPTFFLHLLFGPKFVSMAWFLPIYGIAMLILALNTVFINYYLSLGKIRFAWVLLILVALEFLLIWRYHSSVLEIGKILIGIQAATFVTLSSIYLKNHLFKLRT